MATWSAFSIGGLDPIATDWQRSRDRKDAEWSISRQKEYDQWKADLDYNYSYNYDFKRWNELYPFTYHQQLQAQRDDYDLESGLRSDRYVDTAKDTRAALVAAGYNPLLAVDNVAGSMSASPLVASAFNSASHSSSGASVGAINRSPSFNSGITGTPYDWASAKQALENSERQGALMDAQRDQTVRQGALIDAQRDETLARAEVARNSAAKIKKETELTGYDSPTKSVATIARGLSDEVDKGEDAAVVNTARALGDAVKDIISPVRESDNGGFSRNLIHRFEKAGIPWYSLSRDEALKRLKEHNKDEKK